MTNQVTSTIERRDMKHEPDWELEATGLTLDELLPDELAAVQQALQYAARGELYDFPA